MRILSITAQKPDSTGSGVYLTELVKCFAHMGEQQAVVAGVYREDQVELPLGVKFYPVYFETKKLPWPIAGMSDEMPYRSTRYRDMTEEMVQEFREAFLEVISRAVEELDPDLILCHHLYLLTALVRERFPKRRIYGFCHNTDIRQMEKTALEREYIARQIRGLDGIFVPQKAQREKVMEIYQAEQKKIWEVGVGYNSQIFRPVGEKAKDGVTRMVYAGKIAEKKGVLSLLRALRRLEIPEDSLTLSLAGGAGNDEEYQRIQEAAEECPYPVEFLGRLSQEELAKVYNRCQIFVLPSFFDGLPLTVIEALACHDRVVVTDLPGIQEWLGTHAPGGDVRYVTLPRMRDTDEPVLEELPEFEERLARALEESIEKPLGTFADVRGISWEGISRKVLGMDEQEEKPELEKKGQES
ncbi:MAG TPA: glycosyltransferase family 4 protein [Candidatus Dorea gallistercoris]|uniref:Glycosyltransferase family 4 protein n=1 Tax=Candidatus Dorea gallistercoris TaxID=2838542 RepID=A0A9D1UE80_9FIRM|nr:glycosyltransferase family 4 protein [Candidatus Dorea gallistercoris]